MLRSARLALYVALFSSGAAGLINETVWQRALRMYLSGSEALSSMIVVIVFLSGIALGSFVAGGRVARIARPLRWLAGAEIGLAAATLVVAYALSFDLAEAANGLRHAAVGLGVSIPVLSACGSAVLLLGPCMLMGTILPLASEAAQRQLREHESVFVTRIFVVSTLGAAAGTLAAGFYLLPVHGQRFALSIASLTNLAAAVLVGVISRQPPGAARAAADPAPLPRSGPRLAEGCVAFALGFLALSYEMYLFRQVALIHTPLPYNFCSALCAYLVLWSVGVFVAGRSRLAIGLPLALSAAGVMLAPVLARRLEGTGSIAVTTILLALPCLAFGAAFASILQRVSLSWGRDVGWFCGLNTLGSATGIVLATLVGYEHSPTALAAAIGCGYLALLVAFAGPGREQWAPIGAPLVVALAAGTLAVLEQRNAAADPSQLRLYYGREGVVAVKNGRAMYWDGLWHSDLADVRPHVGTKNWLLATVPLLAHRGGQPIDALVIGLGTGITAATLARSDAVRSVDVFELNPRLRQLLIDYPKETLGVGTNPKVRISWNDVRLGLALSDSKYDLITQQPLYLKQAGSSMLLSREYFELVRRHLKPGGVFCVYSNSFGHEGQALVVRRTAKSVFPAGQSFGRGYMLVLSNEPIAYPADDMERRLDQFDREDIVAREMRSREQQLADYLDRPRLDWEGTPVLVTDDHPVVEYPEIADDFARSVRARMPAGDR